MTGRGPRRLATLLPVAVTLLLALSVPATAGADTAEDATTEQSFAARLNGAFAFGPCPEGAPQGAQCLTDDVHGRATALGRVTGRFDVVFDVAAFGEDQCGPIRKEGALTAANGDQLTIRATGTFCFTNTIAAYVFTITGGTGRFEGAGGDGVWYVPAPTTFDGTSGNGPEYLYGAIVLQRGDQGPR